MSKYVSGSYSVLNGNFIRLNQKTIEKTGPSADFDFLRDTKGQDQLWRGRKISQNLKRARLLDLSLWVTSKGSSRNPSRKLKNLNVPSYEALVSFGPYTGRISVETYFCWCPPKQGWIKSKVLFPSGRLESH